MESSPYHPGELEMQRKTGEEIFANRNARIIVPVITAGAAKYLEQQPFVIVSSQDKQGRIWASILAGEEGFVKVLKEKLLQLDSKLIYTNPNDCFWENINQHPFMGVLFIEPVTRRRYRLNGQLKVEKDQVFLSVKQAYANCPKYIQRRRIAINEKPASPAKAVSGSDLTDELINLIKEADTFFVGSSNGQDEMDASHRGGNPGFVEVVNSTTLRIPDYEGNSMFNTLGNFLVNPKAGLLFIDFRKHRTLQLTGITTINWPDENQLMSPKNNTNRFWTFTVEEWLLLENLQQAEWSFLDYSPFNPM